VVHESLDTYFARAHRDNAVIMRAPGITKTDVKAMRTLSGARAPADRAKLARPPVDLLGTVAGSIRAPGVALQLPV
jgi:hypothetical protein